MGITLKHSVGEDQISNRAYNLIIGFSLLWGFFINAFMVNYCTDFFLQMNPILLIVLYFALAIIGTIIAKASFNPYISFIGYNLIVVPVGAVLSVFLVDYSPDIVFKAVIGTGIVVLVMTTLAAIYPDFFLGLGRTLFIALLLAIIVEFVMMLLGMNPGWMDWLVIVIFCGFIGFDWARANTYARTADNAIDCVIELYLDIINIFIRLVSIFGRSSSSSSSD